MNFKKKYSHLSGNSIRWRTGISTAQTQVTCITLTTWRWQTWCITVPKPVKLRIINNGLYSTL